MAQRKDEQRQRGLPSLAESREQRRRALVFGKVRFREAAPQFWLWTAVTFLAFGVIYWFYSERELARQKSAVMAKQRAISQELTPRLVPLKERLEKWTVELAGQWSEPLVADALDVEQLSKESGVYLRLLLEDAKTPESIADAARKSLHDGFTSCLFVRQETMDPEKADKCFSPSQCADGELCNEWGLCSPPTQPYNMRLMYGALRILSSDWTDELHEATSDYQVRVFDRDLEKVARTDVKIAVELVSTARFFTVLLDETPEQGLPPLAEGADAGGLGRPELRIQGIDHPVRLGIWDLESEEQLFRVRLDAGAEFVPMGRMKAMSQRSLDAQQRQVNNCGIAADLRRMAKARRAAPAEAESGQELPTAAEAKPEAP